MHKYNDIAVRWFFFGFLLFFIFSSMVIIGCVTPLQRVIEKTGGEQLLQMDEKQITAWKNAGHAVRACLQINGPPATGSGTIMITPATDTQPVNFGTDCHPIPPPIVITTSGATVATTTTTTLPVK